MKLGAYSVTETINIERSPEEVFGVIADPGNDHKWCLLVPESRFTGDPATGLGSYEFVQLLPGGRRLPGWGEILELNRPTGMRSRSGFERTVIESTFELVLVAGGTRIDHTNAVRWHGWQRFMHPMLRRATRKNAAAQLVALKALIEQR
jgi:hypothetical protein